MVFQANGIWFLVIAAILGKCVRTSMFYHKHFVIIFVVTAVQSVKKILLFPNHTFLLHSNFQKNE